MIKKLTVALLLLITGTQVFAQRNADSIAYQLQRKKINNLLSQRKEKFGQYDVSLDKHTGIFGLQTKKDIRRSNDILMDIVETDNTIFKELKILLDYRTFQQTQAQAQTKSIENDRLAYISSINRLRKQKDELKAELDKQKAKETKTDWNHGVVVGILLGICVILLLLLRKKKAKA